MKTVSTTKAPAAIGPYSQAQIVGGLVYTSGQMAGIPQLSGPSRSHIEGAADSVSQAVSSVQMPDMQQLMEMAGPLLSMMNGQNK